MDVGRVRKTSRQSGAVYTALRVILHQMTSRERVDKPRRDKSNLPEGSLQQYKCLIDGPTMTNYQFLFGPLFKKTEAFYSRFKNNFQQENSHLEKLKELIGLIE